MTNLSRGQLTRLFLALVFASGCAPVIAHDKKPPPAPPPAPAAPAPAAHASSSMGGFEKLVLAGIVAAAGYQTWVVYVDPKPGKSGDAKVGIALALKF